MLNFKACGTPLNIMQSSKYFAQNFFIMIGTTSKGGTVKLVTFIFPPLAKGHPNIYIYIYAPIDFPRRSFSPITNYLASKLHWRTLRGTGGRCSQSLRWEDGPCLRSPNIWKTL